MKPQKMVMKASIWNVEAWLRSRKALYRINNLQTQKVSNFVLDLLRKIGPPLNFTVGFSEQLSA